MEIRLIALCCGFVLLAGCGSPWLKPGASKQEFAADNSECIDESQRTGGPLYGNPFTFTGFFERGYYTDRRWYNACMVEHGWSQGGG